MHCPVGMLGHIHKVCRAIKYTCLCAGYIRTQHETTSTYRYQFVYLPHSQQVDCLGQTMWVLSSYVILHNYHYELYVLMHVVNMLNTAQTTTLHMHINESTYHNSMCSRIKHHTAQIYYLI